MIIFLIILTIILYWAGGQGKEWWGDTHVRDFGCPICMLLIAWLTLGWSWWLMGLVISVGGLSIGDYGKFYWTPHAFVISLGMVAYGVFTGCWLTLVVAITFTTVTTYLVSRFLNKWGLDVILRGLIYACLPLWFLLRIGG